jgi:hypothetical protein
MLRFILDHQNSQSLFLQLRDLFSYGAVTLRAGNSNGVLRGGAIDTKLILSKD